MDAAASLRKPAGPYDDAGPQANGDCPFGIAVADRAFGRALAPHLRFVSAWARQTHESGVDPKEILSATFTRVAAEDLGRDLVGMGVLPLEFPQGQTWQSLGLSGEETYDIAGLDDSLQPRASLEVVARAADGSTKKFTCRLRIDTGVELDYYRNGGILQTVLRKLLAD